MENVAIKIGYFWKGEAEMTYNIKYKKNKDMKGQKVMRAS